MQSSGYFTSCESLESRLRYTFSMVDVAKCCLPILLSCMSKVGENDVSCLFERSHFISVFTIQNNKFESPEPI